ncbi:Uma2 family endonuclease [Nostoc sp.]|uniref:Uma2 family endonuclease n=1 Tax=Nostoc sp. TaxID=1180 RepID=UPI003593E36F
MQITQQRYYTLEEYLELEEAADYKSEYIDGQIIPLAGGTVNHNQIALNLSTELNFAFKKQNYRVFRGDVRLWISQKRTYRYPDVMILAGEPEFFNNRREIILNPQVIVEVLSKSTKCQNRLNLSIPRNNLGVSLVLYKRAIALLGQRILKRFKQLLTVSEEK